MKTVHGAVLSAFFALIAFLAWLAERSDEPKLFIGLIGTLLVFGLIGLLASFAKDQDEGRQKLYFTVIGTLVGLVGGLAGGAAIGDQAAESAADGVKDEVKTQVEQAASE